ncbi:Putative secreted protein [[Actinomadura] parvosata subsp. kistnae]|nr:Putative secreted protein [Actinomadura parvosata subsp. kistnae]
MTGHLLVRNQDGDFLGHVHEMGTPGARLRFTFSFPTPGRYLAWIQYATADRIVTTPFTVDVTASEARR